MPRPRRDYGVTIRQDLEEIDTKMRELALKRARLQAMLAQYENTPAVDVAGVLREVGRDKTKRRKRS